MIRVMALVVAVLRFVAAQTPPFRFGTDAGDVFTGPNVDGASARVFLPKSMTYFGSEIASVIQLTSGLVYLYKNNTEVAGKIYVYNLNIDTRNGGSNQNQIWLRAGNNSNDLILARDIIAGYGTLFTPQAILVATWYKVEAFSQRVGAQNTFQCIMPYSATGESWLILAYSQLQFFRDAIFSRADVRFTNPSGQLQQQVATVDSNTTMNRLLNGTNCNRTGVYVFRVNAGTTQAPTKTPTKPPTKAPTKAPTNAPIKAPTKFPTNVPTITPTPKNCGLFGWNIYCPRTRCGLFGRWLGWCPWV
jgi:hypothetical protein